MADHWESPQEQLVYVSSGQSAAWLRDLLDWLELNGQIDPWERAFTEELFSAWTAVQLPGVYPDKLVRVHLKRLKTRPRYRLEVK